MLVVTPNVVRNPGNGRVVSQGEYWVVAGDPAKESKAGRMDSWIMYAMPDGSYEVEVEISVPPGDKKILERHTFTSDFRPTGLSFSVVGMDADEGGPVQLDCDYAPAEIRCRMTYEGSTSSATLAQSMPYVFMPSAEAPVLDTPWFAQMLVGQARRTAGYQTPVPVVTVDDGETENSMVLKVDETEQVKYLGQEKIEVMNQQILADKFQITDDDDRPQNFWLSSSGLLLQLDMGDVKIVLRNYQGTPLDSLGSRLH